MLTSIDSSLVERFKKIIPVWEGPCSIPTWVKNCFPFVRWMSRLMHPWHVWPWINCQSLMVGQTFKQTMKFNLEIILSPKIFLTRNCWLIFCEQKAKFWTRFKFFKSLFLLYLSQLNNGTKDLSRDERGIIFWLNFNSREREVCGGHQKSVESPFA